MFEPAEPVERAVFPSVSPGAAALGNRLISRETGFNATIMNEERSFALSTLMTALDASGLVLRCKLGGGDVLISVSDDQLHELLPKIAADISISDLPDTLVAAVAETAVRPILTGLAAYLNLQFSLGKVEDNPPTDWIGVSLYERAGQNVGPVAALHFSADSLDILSNALAAVPTVHSWAGAENVQVKIEMQFWRTAMPASDIADLDCGDVVLLPQDYPADRVSLIIGDQQAILGTGSRNGCVVTVEELKGNNHD